MSHTFSHDVFPCYSLKDGEVVRDLAQRRGSERAAIGVQGEDAEAGETGDLLRSLVGDSGHVWRQDDLLQVPQGHPQGHLGHRDGLGPGTIGPSPPDGQYTPLRLPGESG